MVVSAGHFKAHCLKLMDDVEKTHIPITITKHGKPVARLAPIDTGKKPAVFGMLKGTVSVKGDIIKPAGERWNANE
jgi:prevent-host-death family protein